MVTAAGKELLNMKYEILENNHENVEYLIFNPVANEIELNFCDKRDHAFKTTCKQSEWRVPLARNHLAQTPAVHSAPNSTCGVLPSSKYVLRTNFTL